MIKVQVLEQIRQARQELVAALFGLPDEGLVRPFAIGHWSIKDTLAHLAAWQSEIITSLAKLSPKDAPNIVEIEDIDEWNEELYHAAARRPLEAVLEDWRNVHTQLLKVVEALDEETLTNPRRFVWMEGEPLWYLIAENGFWHEQEHAEQIRQWRQAQNL